MGNNKDNEMFKKFTKYIERDGIDELVAYLDVIGYYKTPASSSNHMSEEGGLLQHSINVTSTMFDLNSVLKANITNESMAIVGLFHDIGKCSYYNKPLYIENILKSGKRSESKPYERNKELLGIPHEVIAIQQLTKFIKLTEDEVFAIYYHNGLYTPSGYDLKNGGKETELYLILHFSDLYSSRIIER